MAKLHVFVDESGDEHLGLERGASKFYVITAVSVSGDRLAEFLAAMGEVRRKNFQSGEIKSSKVGDNFGRRASILREMHGLAFSVVSVVVPKNSIRTDSGLRFAESFLKFSAKMLCLRLPKFGDISVSFDAKGRQRFRDSFVSYLRDRFSADDLFRSVNFNLSDSKDDLGVQAADFFAGSTFKLFASPGLSEKYGVDGLVIGKSEIFQWPTLRATGALPNEPDARIDELVRREAAGLANQYLSDEHPLGDEDSSLRSLFVSRLIAVAMQDGGFLQTKGFCRDAKLSLGISLTDQALRNRVIGPLRDRGLLISSSKKGYKIPESARDIGLYVELCDSQIPPNLARLARARNIVRGATAGEFDILGGEGYSNLRGLVDVIIRS